MIKDPYFVVHARKAWLEGLSPRQNRNVPQLNYNFVYDIAKERENIKFVINGGIQSVSDVKMIMENFNGDLMIGRAAYDDPFLLYSFMQGYLLFYF